MSFAEPRVATQRSTAWWLSALRRRRERMYEEGLNLTEPVAWASEEERQAAIKFFNAAFRAEESGLRQAHELAEEVAAMDPDLAETLRLYGDEEGWHRELLVEFMAKIGGEIRPMGRVTRTFYSTYARAEDMETIMLTNLMFETIGATTYRLALGRVNQPDGSPVRQMLTILTRDESFHVPLNVHFIRRILAHLGTGPEAMLRRVKLRAVYHAVYVSLVASAWASRRVAREFDRISFQELGAAYVSNLGQLFLAEPDLGLTPPEVLLRAFGSSARTLRHQGAPSMTSVAAAEAAVDRERVVVQAL
jgi:hypothetical protein